MARSRKKKRNKNLSYNWFKDKRIHTLLGLFIILLSVFLLISLTSYLFTWKADDALIGQQDTSVLFDAEKEASNWLGRLGAFISKFFFFYLFGIASFVIPFIIFQLGYIVAFGGSIKKFINQVLYTLYTLVLVSVLMEFIMDFALEDSHFPWGGAIGEFLTNWFSSFIGTIGTFFFLLFLTATYLILLFNINLREFSLPKFKQEFNWGGFGKNSNGDQDLDQRETKSRPEDKKIPWEDTVYEYSDVDMEDEGDDDSTETDQSFSLSNDAPIENSVESKPKLEKESSEIEINKEDDINPEMDIATEDEYNLDTEYDPSLELSGYKKPTLDLLMSHDSGKVSINREELEDNKNQIINTLSNYKIDIVKIRATIGPTVTLYEIVPAPGVRISKIKNLEDDIALSLAALGIRIIAPIPGKGTIGIEVPNKKKQIVSLKEIIRSEKFKNTKMLLPIALGKTISNEVFIADLSKMPHLLIAGATGQGKSVGINAILISILYHNHPSRVKLVLIDPKKVELFPYGNLEHHFLAQMPGQEEPIITDTTKVIETLNSLCIEMDQRYDLLKKGRARNIREYNNKFVDRKLNPKKGHKFLPFIVLVIDEFADLIMTAGKEIEMPIARLAQLARAVGIHLVIATQRPSVKIITGIIKANFPARIAFKVTSQIDSRTILDGGGANQLIGRGDMLLSVGGDIIRLQCAFVDTPEVEEVLEYISKQKGYPEPYLLPEFSTEEGAGPGGISVSELDEMFTDAAHLVYQAQSGSTSMIQRKLKLGFNRAGRIMDQLEAFGIVGASEGSKAREVLIHSEDELNRLLSDIFSSN
nr:DNA translocase FtsK [Saprospiraceae bacterium]